MRTLVTLTLLLLCGSISLGQDMATTQMDRAEMRQEILAEADFLQRELNHLKNVVKFVRPSVVHIETTTANNSGYASSSQVDEAGAGIVFQQGTSFFVLTNRHVINQAPLERIKIYLEDGRVIKAKRVLTDRDTDVAVVEVESDRLIPAEVGDSSEVEVGEKVFAVGSPFGLSQTVTYGIISAVGRRNLQLGRQGLKLQNFFQTDAAINPGNSGGPLFNLRGEVVGLNTAIASNSGGNDGIGFAIPIHAALGVAEQLLENGQVARAFFGVRMDADFDAAAANKIGLFRARGAKVSGITPGSPAEAAMIEVGDVITKFYGQEVEDDLQLINIVSLCPLDEDIRVEIFRDGKFVEKTVRLAARKQFED
ncbi:PDZ domain-containing protein [Bremerella cremea]|uniref:Serine protease n=1 Tax=Blastopirellula marina TaxID=124 RepID=A0A2S8FVA0_9BACT|nr:MULTISPECIES: trypsin-like peptidase domain-containing protein [Pirellulaceae]PQO36083.1 serine protease [Blastopirellula marina]RCS48760.1 PDZ domain-containing protein [Bremerella cremea]